MLSLGGLFVFNKNGTGTGMEIVIITIYNRGDPRYNGKASEELIIHGGEK